MFELFPSTLRKKLTTLYWTDPWFSFELLEDRSEEKEDKKTFTLEVPGYDKEDLEVHQNSEGIKVVFKDNKRVPLLLWVDSTKFDLEETQAVCSKGILIIEVPRKKTSQGRTIKIE